MALRIAFWWITEGAQSASLAAMRFEYLMGLKVIGGVKVA